jgi:hypothetical protein
MQLLEDKLIELDFFPHSDLSISWPKCIEESVSTETGRGHIVIKYSEVPVFVYVLASKVGTDFLPEKILEEAKSTNFVSFAHEEYTELYENIKSALGFRRKLWELLEDKKARDQIFDEQLRYLKEKLSGCEYIGFVPSSAEYSSVDILYQDGYIYLAQRKNILRLNEELSKEILKRTVEHYGILISPVLRPLLEK